MRISKLRFAWWHPIIIAIIGCILVGIIVGQITPPDGGGGAPSGSASGDLGGTYPGPTVVGLGGGDATYATHILQLPSTGVYRLGASLGMSINGTNIAFGNGTLASLTASLFAQNLGGDANLNGRIGFGCNNTSDVCMTATDGTQRFLLNSSRLAVHGGIPICFTASTATNNACDTGISRISADKVGCGNGTLSDVTCNFQAGLYSTGTNCASSASPAVCVAAPAGSAVIAAATTTVIVNTTAVTANSDIHITEDASLGTRLGVTCNTQSSLVLGTPRVSARVAGTSFTVILDVAPTTNPACFNYWITN